MDRSQGAEKEEKESQEETEVDVLWVFLMSRCFKDRLRGASEILFIQLSHWHVKFQITAFCF